MKSFTVVVFSALLLTTVNAQTQQQMDSVYSLLQNTANDTILMSAYATLGSYYDDISLLSALDYCEKGVELAQELDFKLNEAEALGFMSFPLMKLGNYLQALRVLNQAFEIANDQANEESVSDFRRGQSPRRYRLSIINLLYLALENLYGYTGNYEKQIEVAFQARALYEAEHDTLGLAFVFNDIGDAHLNLNNLDSAIYYEQKSLAYFSRLEPEDRKFEGSVYTSIGRIYEQLGDLSRSKENYEKAIRVSAQRDNLAHTANACIQLANLYKGLNEVDSVFYYANKALTDLSVVGRLGSRRIAYRMISDCYMSKGNRDAAYTYLHLAANASDRIDGEEKKRLQEFQVAAFNQELELQEQEQKRIEKEGKLKTIAIMALVVVFGTIGFLLYRNNRQKHRANEILQQKNTEVELALHELKATQQQLIQSEKMASLGELTAGIAHEIQNPLNFVNNFSEVSSELIDEMKSELATSNWQQATEISDNIKENLNKILHHGKRADGIVKSMLQHSRASSGQKELTDINALCDEYLRLAFHGYRAKDKSFNAKFETDFDESIPKLNIVPQDVGRVILNLINNAFYAVSEKAQHVDSADFNPLVTVSTRIIDNKVQISVKDNANGIPESIKEKIFQPFFTTKPAGQGTGLGLSLGYDIIKAHGGEVRVESEDGKGTEFMILLAAK